MNADELAKASRSLVGRFRSSAEQRAVQESQSHETPTEGEGTQVLEPQAPPTGIHEDVRDIALVDVIASPYQPRRRELKKKDTEELARLIQANGQLSPILVTPSAGESEGKYIVHSGHRRCEALRALGWPTVKAIIRRDMSERDARKTALADNLGREDLSAFEQAHALRDYAEVHDIDLAAAAKELGLRRTHTQRLQSLLKISPELRTVIEGAGLTARSLEPFVRLDAQSPKKAARMAAAYLQEAIGLKAVEDALAASSPARSQRAVKDVDFKVAKNKAHMSLHVPTVDMSDSQRERVVAAIASFLGHIGVAKVDAVAPGSTETVDDLCDAVEAL